MKKGFFPKLAWTGIRNNRKLYVPYLLTCVGMVMMQYIVSHLSSSDVLLKLRGGWALRDMLSWGNFVIAFFAFLFLSYSNSFLMRRRKKEFGLYNILGMGKLHLAYVLFWETLITAALSIGLGLFAGVVLSKAAELCIVNMMAGSVSYALTFSINSIVMTIVIYAAVFVFILLRALWQIRKASAITLLRSENTGDKIKRFYWFWGVLGVVVLVVAYYIAVTIEDPVSALAIFFVAVALVIAATYMLFGSGSVLLCKLLQKNKKYYYKANHFVSVSSMAYRMTRTGAGLASICILLTMVLVMLSSTSCLFFGVDDALNIRYPRQLTVDAYVDSLENADYDDLQPLRDYVSAIVGKHGAEQENIVDYRAATVYGQIQGTELETDVNNIDVSFNDYSAVCVVNFIPLDDYNRLTGEEHVLESGEVLMYAFRVTYPGDTLTVLGANTSFRIKGRLEDFPVDGDTMSGVVASIYLVIPDFQTTLDSIAELKNGSGGSMLDIHWAYYFDTNVSEDVQRDIYEEMGYAEHDSDQSYLEHLSYIRYSSRADDRNNFTGTFAGLFMLGLILSIVFLFAAVLMIYYKQVTEGYEDQNRFSIMRKVGMTKRDIRKSINSQMLTVFLLPLLTAGLHLCFAFPMIRLLLSMFSMTNTTLFVKTCLISYAIFGLFYIIVYRITSNAYYSIVSGAKEA